MKLEELLKEMEEKMNNRDLSDKYLEENNFSTRDEIGISEYAYGISMIPCSWVYPYLEELRRLRIEMAAMTYKSSIKGKEERN